MIFSLFKYKLNIAILAYLEINKVVLIIKSSEIDSIQL